MLAVPFFAACFGFALALSLVGPILVGLAYEETAVSARMAIYMLLGCFLFGAVALAILDRQRRTPRVGRLMLLTLIWTMLPAASAVPIADISELSLVDSLFEAVSGLTTSGATVLNTTEIWPKSLLFWRVQLQWLGGYLAVLTVLLILAPMGIGGIMNRSVTSYGSGTDLLTNSRRLGVFMTRFALVYAAMTMLCFAAFFLSGTPAFPALTLAMTAVSTGGFLAFDGNLDQTLSRFGLFVFGIFLLLGATSVFWQRMVLEGQFRRLGEHRESYSVILLATILTFVFFTLIVSGTATDEQAAAAAIVEGFVNASSLVATSGVQSRPGIFPLIPLTLVLFIVLAGGSAFSTTGGLKHYRLGGMMVQSWAELDRLIYPNSVQSSRFGSQRYDITLMKAIWSFFIATILTIAIATILIGASGIPFEAALTATVANFSTAGPIYSAGWEAPGTESWPAYSDLTNLSKCVLMIVMILGRLEVLAVIGVFSVRYWRSR